MSRRRWYERPGFSIEQEATRYEQAGLVFSLDQRLFEEDGSVVFVGHLRLGERSVPAKVLYPPAYDKDAQPLVVAPTLPVGRHKGVGGALCLDHPVLGELHAMSGAEAVKRAENLWWYWENDRERLRELEADAPDPRAAQVLYEPKSAIVLTDVELGDGERGVLKLGLSQIKPGRGAVTGVRIDEPDRGELALATANALFAGPREVVGVWKRIDDRPPRGDSDKIVAWASRFDPLIQKAAQLAAVHRQAYRQPDLPAVVGLVYSDEGPGRDEWHDEWLLLLLDPDNFMRVPRSVQIHSREEFLRQPQLAELANRHVGVVGLGAVGSPLATALGRSGVGRFTLVDPDIVSAGNRVRHDLDLDALGLEKVEAMGHRLTRVNPNLEFIGFSDRFGETPQARDDEIYAELAKSNLIINATANTASGYHVAAAGRDAGIPVLHLWVSAGAWGGRVLLQREGSGCPQCMARWQDDEPERVPEWSADPDARESNEEGCANPTFTGPGFEITEIACMAARVAVGMLVADSYPPPPGDLITVRLRRTDDADLGVHVTELPVHPSCEICSDA
jgi:molybdopterin/thiamine biosynthesis adenylyltransferase